MTIYDISQKAGVSIATVSRVINGSPAVTEATREKVLRVIEANGYTPNAFARGLGLNTMKTVGILCADIADAFMSRAISHLEKELRAHGYDALLCCTGVLMQNRRSSLALLLSKNVDGVILVGSNYVSLEEEKNDYLRQAAQKAPLIILNAQLAGEHIYCACCDDREATKNATAALLSQGRRRVLYLFNSRSYSGMKKLEGYRQAYQDADIVPEDALLLECQADDDIHAVTARIAEAAAQGLAFDGVVAATDDMAVAALQYAHRAGLRVPEDVSIIGYNNSSLCACTQPELSSVDNRLPALCATCVQKLMGVLAGETVEPISVFSAELVRRGTTA